MCAEANDEWVGTECELVSDHGHRRIPAKENMRWGFWYLNSLLCRRYSDKSGTYRINIRKFPPWLLCTSSSFEDVLPASRPHNNRL